MTWPCPHCGAPLHWVAVQGSWACQRCQRWIQPAPAPQPGGPGPAGASPPPSGKGRLLVAGVGVLATAGVVVAVVTASAEEIDCARYSETVVAIHMRESPDQPGLERVVDRLSAIYGDSCRAGRVSASQAECVYGAETMTDVERCVGIEPVALDEAIDPPSREADTATPPSTPTLLGGEPLRSDLLGCTPMAELRQRVLACESLRESTREVLVDMADNKLMILDQGVVPEGAYADGLNEKCIGTADYMRQELEASGCGDDSAAPPP